MKVAEEAGVNTTKAKIQDAIWWNCSSINTRILMDDNVIRQTSEMNTANLWEIIQKSVEQFSS
jgi:hypothetical protein